MCSSDLEAYHASKSSVVPHVIKVKKMVDPYIQGARKFTQPYFNQVIIKDIRRSVRKKFRLVWLLEISNLILIGFILRILTTKICLQLLQFYFYCITDFK